MQSKIAKMCFPTPRPFPNMHGGEHAYWGGGGSQKKGAGMFAISLRGVNFRFWSHLSFSGQNTIIFSHKGLF